MLPCTKRSSRSLKRERMESKHNSTRYQMRLRKPKHGSTKTIERLRIRNHGSINPSPSSKINFLLLKTQEEKTSARQLRHLPPRLGYSRSNSGKTLQRLSRKEAMN